MAVQRLLQQVKQLQEQADHVVKLFSGISELSGDDEFEADFAADRILKSLDSLVKIGERYKQTDVEETAKAVTVGNTESASTARTPSVPADLFDHGSAPSPELLSTMTKAAAGMCVSDTDSDVTVDYEDENKNKQRNTKGEAEHPGVSEDVAELLDAFAADSDGDFDSSASQVSTNLCISC